MSSSNKNKQQCFYEVLELQKECTPEEIKSSYKKFALKYHPDKNRDKPEEAKKKFQEISEAYTVLSDPKKRETYDQYGTIDEDEIGFDYDMFMEDFGAGDFGSFISMMMGGGDGFFAQFETSSRRSHKKKYGKKQRHQQMADPFAQMFSMQFEHNPTKKKKSKEEEEWETDSDEEAAKKSKMDQEWETDSEEEFEDVDDEDEDESEAEKKKPAVESKSSEPKEKGTEQKESQTQKKKANKSKSKGGFNPFGMGMGMGMDPISMMMQMGMGMNFEMDSDDEEEELEFLIMQEFAANNVQILKNGNVKCKLCSKTFKEEKLPDHFDNDHETEFDEFKTDFLEQESKGKKKQNKKKSK